MSETLKTILILLILSISGLICSFLCFLSQYKREIWQTLTNTQEDKKEAKND